MRDLRVLEAMREVPRELFVPDGLREFAYEDRALAIAAGQSRLSQPDVVAVMVEATRIQPADRVLVIGAGGGYAAAVLSRLAAQVFAIERHDGPIRTTADQLRRLGYSNVEVRSGDGAHGRSEKAPFDAILVAAGGIAAPQSLLEQLDIGGRLIMPLGETPAAQRLVRVTRTAANRFDQEDLGAVGFVPLIGPSISDQGWDEAATPSRPPAEPKSFRSREAPSSLSDRIRAAAEPLPDIADPAFGALFDRFASAKVVLLGEASHGTAEFYRAARRSPDTS